jgi:flagellar hook-associated protein 3 FlgL
MGIERISTFATHQRLVIDSNRVQSNLLELQKQLSSGRKADDFKGLTGQVEQFTGLEGKINKAKTYQTNNDLIITRLRTANTSMDQIIQIGDDIKNIIVQWRNPALRNNLPINQQLDAFKKSISGMLNQSVEGRYLFGGTRTDIPPVVDPLPQPVTVGTPDASYYQGSEEDVVVRAQDNLEIRYNIRADNPAFQKLYGAIFLAEKAAAANNDDMMKDAFNMVSSGIQQTISAQAEINQNIVNLTQINDRHQTLELYWKGVTEEVSKTDIVGVSTQVAIDQAVLTATYQAFARISQLRLSDYLN